jgi:Arf-GAP/coiled-coil/ANK repeat/PH domain-containing protein
LLYLLTPNVQVTIIKQGYLSKKSQAKKGDWKRRFFVLDSLGMMYYYSHKADTLMQVWHSLV